MGTHVHTLTHGHVAPPPIHGFISYAPLRGPVFHNTTHLEESQPTTNKGAVGDTPGSSDQEAILDIILPEDNKTKLST